MSVLNRKMFNRGARKELRKKGGIEDVIEKANTLK